LDVRDDDLRSLGREPPRLGLALALRRARDQRDLAGEPLGHRSRSWRLRRRAARATAPDYSALRRWMRLKVSVTTGASDSSRHTVSMTKNVMIEPFDSFSYASTMRPSLCSTSPSTIGRWYTNSCSPCRTRPPFRMSAP